MKDALGRGMPQGSLFCALTLPTTIGRSHHDTFVAWNATLGRLTSGVRRNWLRVVEISVCAAPHGARRFVPDPTDSRNPTSHSTMHLQDADILGCSGRRSPRRHRVPRCAGRPSDWHRAVYTSSLRRGELFV
jgi:hypothetical protein